MKIFKISIALLLLLNFTGVTAKTYNPGTPQEKVVPNVFDVCIFLDKINTSGMSQEEETLQEKFQHLQDPHYRVPVITSEIRNMVLDQEAAIVSAPLMRNLCKAAKTWTQSRFKTALDSLLDPQKWDIYFTVNREFVVILPKSKYKEQIRSSSPRGNKINLSRIGLNYHQLERFEPAPPQKAFDSFTNELSKQNGAEHKIDIDTLSNIFFLGKRKIDKRVYLTGHGSDKLGAELIANLPLQDFRKLRDRLDNVDCSITYIDTCCGGSTTFRAQSIVVNRDSVARVPAIPANMGLSRKKFIEITDGIPGVSVYGVKKGFDKFFYRVNNFFENQKKLFRNEFLSGARLKDLEKKQNADSVDVEFLTEQMILSGKKVPLKFTLYEYPGKDYIWKRSIDIGNTLVKRNPNIYSAGDFRDIFAEGFAGSYLENIPSCRFPGSSVFKPIERVIQGINDQHILYSEIQGPEVKQIIIRPDTTDVIIETTIVDRPIYIDTTQRYHVERIPKFHPSMTGRSHHYIKEMIINYIGIRPKLTDIVLKNILPKQPNHDKAIFISKLKFQAQDTPGKPSRNFTAKNIFIFKPSTRNILLRDKNYVCSFDSKRKKYTGTKFLQSDDYATIKRKYKPIDDTYQAELKILRTMGSTKPRVYREETEDESEKVIFDGIEAETKFRITNLKHAKSLSGGGNANHLFVSKYIDHQLKKQQKRR